MHDRHGERETEGRREIKQKKNKGKKMIEKMEIFLLR